MKLKIRFKKLPIFVLATLFTSILFALALVAAPQTERFVGNAKFNLNSNSQNYWKKEFTLQVSIKNQDLPFKEQKLAETEKILYRRLNDYGVEEVTIQQLEGEKETEPILKVTVQSAKDVNLVTPLIQQRYFARLVTRKDGVDFDSEENQFAIFDPANYNDTQFTRRFFRNIYLTKLRNTLGEQSYFAIFKTYALNTDAFDNFITANAGQAAGLRIDGFVTPITIPAPTQSQNGIVTKPVFSIGLNITDQQSEIEELLFNSGVIPLQYSVTATKTLQPQIYQINYIQLALAIVGIMIASTLYFATRKQWGMITRTIFPFAMLISGWLSYLKLTQTPIELFLILIESLILYLLLLIVSKEKNSNSFILGSTLFFAILYFFGIGYVRTFALHMTYLVPALLLSRWVVNLYINTVKKTVEK